MSWEMDNSYILKNLCGIHEFSGIEFTDEDADDGYRNVILFTMDGNNYKMTEDPADGYRSFCKEIVTTDKVPNNIFKSVEVFCHMMEDDGYGNEVLVVRDLLNGKIILQLGTKHADDYYPYCLFEYTPENMSCNEGR